MRRLRFPPQVAGSRSGHLAAGLADELIETLEARALWQRFGL
jgi:hypothetical protein